MEMETEMEMERDRGTRVLQRRRAMPEKRHWRPGEGFERAFAAGGL